MEISNVLGDNLDNLLNAACGFLEDEPSCLRRPVPTDIHVRPSLGLPPAFPNPQPAPSPRLPSARFRSDLCHLNSLDFPPRPGDGLDALDSFTSAAAPFHSPLRAGLVLGGQGLDSLSEFTLPEKSTSNGFLASKRIPVANGHLAPELAWLSRNPLEATYEFHLACSTCYVKTGPGLFDYHLQEALSHDCLQSFLLCRGKGVSQPTWKHIRPRPKGQHFTGPYVLCKDILEQQDCKYGEGCSFAKCQEEIDVWTLEREGALIRELAFKSWGSSLSSETMPTISQMFHLPSSIFMYLCQACFDSKPQIISKRCQEKRANCNSPTVQHVFDYNKCLVHIQKSSGKTWYTKIRQVQPSSQLDLCRPVARHCCQHEGHCLLAHSVVELKCWVLQRYSGTSHDDIVQESKRHRHKQEQLQRTQRNSLSPVKLPGSAPVYRDNSPSATRRNALSPGARPSNGGACGTANRGQALQLNMRMKFVCSQCWKDGVVSEPDRSFKHCLGKGRHSLSKERWLLLVKASDRQKWVMVRSPPSRTPPLKYDICLSVLRQKKCLYTGNCSFAHSEEERDVWTYMKNAGLQDMEHMFDQWIATRDQQLQIAPPSPLLEQPYPNPSSPYYQQPDKLHILMPTDLAENLTGFHCRLCGRHSNSQHQWQQHIKSETHKERVIRCEEDDDDDDWVHRFPGLYFSLCPGLDGECTVGLACDFAHSQEELDEWRDRRASLRRKLARARADKLIAADDFNFGRYNYLFRDSTSPQDANHSD